MDNENDEPARRTLEAAARSSVQARATPHRINCQCPHCETERMVQALRDDTEDECWRRK